MTALPSRWRAPLVLAALSSALPGCYSKATGYHGKLTFAYASGVEIENFVKPIAPGAKLEVVALANGTENELTVTSARSSRPGVLTVETLSARSVVLRGVAPGVADLEITARDETGTVRVDTMFLHVAKPTVHRLEHACTAGPEAAYVVGDRVDIYHGLATDDGRPVIGYAYAPLRIAPALELVAQPQEAPVYSFRTRRPEERVSVRSLVDGSELSLRVVAKGELKEAALDCAGDCRAIEGESQYLVARVRLGDTPLCSQNALTRARSLTPDICSVTAKLEDDDGTDSNHEQLAVLTGLKLGLCRYEVSLPELDGGRGIVLPGTAKIGRLQFPEEGARVARPPLGRRVLVAGLAFGWWLAPKLLALACVAWIRRRRVVAAIASRLRGRRTRG